jgi:hypothetical protein
VAFQNVGGRSNLPVTQSYKQGHHTTYQGVIYDVVRKTYKLTTEMKTGAAGAQAKVPGTRSHASAAASQC